MGTEPDKDEPAIRSSSFKRIFPWLCGGMILLALAVGDMTRSRPDSETHQTKSAITRTKPLVILKMDTNGVLSFHGISLANPMFRHTVFNTLKLFRQKVGINISPFPIAQKAYIANTNMLDTIVEIQKAGL